MNDQARRIKIQQFAEAINARDMEVFDAVYHDDVVIHWPQSGEVIRGKKNIRELREAHPTPPTGTLRRIIGSGGWVTVLTSAPSSALALLRAIAARLRGVLSVQQSDTVRALLTALNADKLTDDLRRYSIV